MNFAELVANAEPTEEVIRVRYGETDQMGHAYYANYLFWFEQARGSWFRERGLTYVTLEKSGIFLPVVECHVRYRGEIKYDEEIVVKVWLESLGRASAKVSYEVTRKGEDVVLTEGYTVHVFMGLNRKAFTIPDEMREWLKTNLTIGHAVT